MNSLFFGTLAISRVVFHTEIVTHFMSDSSCYQSHDVRVIHRDTTGEFVRTYWSLKRFSNHASFESDSAKNTFYVFTNI